MRDHAHTLSDFRVPTLSIECDPCGRRGRYNIARLMEKYGAAGAAACARQLPEGQGRERRKQRAPRRGGLRGARRALHVGEGRVDGPSLRLLDRLASRESVRIRTLAIALSGA